MKTDRKRAQTKASQRGKAGRFCYNLSRHAVLPEACQGVLDGRADLVQGHQAEAQILVVKAS